MTSELTMSVRPDEFRWRATETMSDGTVRETEGISKVLPPPPEGWDGWHAARERRYADEAAARRRAYCHGVTVG